MPHHTMPVPRHNFTLRCVALGSVAVHHITLSECVPHANRNQAVDGRGVAR